jgi:gluconolactonase
MIPKWRLLLVAIVACFASLPAALSGQPQAQSMGDLVPKDVAAVPAAVVCFLEGPAADAEGNVFFSDMAGNRILKMNPKGDVSVFRADSGRTNGNVFDALGRLVSCEGSEQGPGRRRLVRTDMKTGKVEVLTEKYDGKRYNSPNDCCIDTSGRIWFTDPRYAADRSDLEMDVEGVYRIDANGKVTRVLTQKEVERPNGIAVTPDAKTLYVIDSHPKVGGNRKIWAFAIQPDGSLADRHLVYDFGKGRGGDGMKLDVKGNLPPASTSSVHTALCSGGSRSRRTSSPTWLLAGPSGEPCTSRRAKRFIESRSPCRGMPYIRRWRRETFWLERMN